MVISKLKSVNIDPKQLKNITKYIEFFDPDNLNEMENVGKDMRSVDTRKASLETTKYKVLNGNIVFK